MLSRFLTLLLGAFTLLWLSMPSIAEDTESDADIIQRVVDELLDEAGQPASCADWLSHVFWEDATKADVERCVASEADVNARSSNGWTPLHFAAKDGDMETVDALLAAGATLNARNDDGKTPLHVAIWAEEKRRSFLPGAPITTIGPRVGSELWQCHADLEACEEKLSKTFLAVVIQWPTRLHDVDLHIIDPAGNEFYYQVPRHPPRPGELSADTTTGPGVEIWEVAEAPPGEYRVLYNLYSHHDNPEDAVVKGGAYHRDGHDAFRERRLAREGRDNALLVAIITVGDDGNVEIEER